MGDWPNQARLSALHIKRACEASLRRLQTDCIDLYQMHHVDRDTPWEEIWQAMEQLVREGKILYVGPATLPAGNLRRPRNSRAAVTSWGSSRNKVCTILNERTIELEVLPGL